MYQLSKVDHRFKFIIMASLPATVTVNYTAQVWAQQRPTMRGVKKRIIFNTNPLNVLHPYQHRIHASIASIFFTLHANSEFLF